MRFGRPNLRVKYRNGSSACNVKTEYNGRNDATHTVALGLCSIPSANTGTKIDSPWFMLGMAVLRRILKKHYGVDIRTYAEEIDSLIPAVYLTQTNVISTHCKLVQIQFYAKNLSSAGNYSLSKSFTVDIPTTGAAAVDKQVRAIAILIGEGLRQQFGATFAETVAGEDFNYSTRNTQDLYGYALNEYVAFSGNTLNGPSTRVWTQVFPMDKWKFSLKYNTVVRIENQSAGVTYEVEKAVTGNTTTTTTRTKETMDYTNGEHNTIVGKLYHFSDPYPVPNVKTYSHTFSALNSPLPIAVDVSTLFRDSNGDGIIKPSGTDIPVLRHIPPASLFENCRRYTNVSLKPGENKSHVMKFYFEGYINKLIEGLRYTAAFNGLLGNTVWYGAHSRTSPLGTHDLFVFEDYNGSHIGTTENPGLAIGYQVMRYGSCKYIGCKKNGMDIMLDYDVPVTTVTADT